VGTALPEDERWLVPLLQRVMVAAAPALVPERQDFRHGDARKVEFATQRVLQAIGRGLFQGAWALQGHDTKPVTPPATPPGREERSLLAAALV